jgi:AbrB family transcriptional regulator (stage V sporulation protein T)
VIPKEIRRTLRIREGDPLEIYTGTGGEVVFKKYSPIGELSDFATQYAESLAQATSLPVLICDRDHCVAASGISKKEVLERRVTPSLEEIMEQRRSVSFTNGEDCPALEGVKRNIRVGVPIINAGDVSGAVVLVADEYGNTTRPGIFASGDVVLGARTVVEAVAHSKIVAETMHKYMQSLDE